MAIRRKRIQELVEKVLRENSVDRPPVPVERIAKALGIQILHQKYEEADVSGFLYRDATRAIIGVNRTHHSNRKRFTIAHEIGHFLLHKGNFKEVHVDRAFQVKLRNDLSSQGTDFEEVEANAYAAELLLPSSFIREDLAEMGAVDIEDEESIKTLARRYKVSPQTLVFRLANLGYVSL
jgi:Zn-dependent peptidase ImmA (M78 family)